MAVPLPRGSSLPGGRQGEGGGKLTTLTMRSYMGRPLGDGWAASLWPEEEEEEDIGMRCSSEEYRGAALRLPMVVERSALPMAVERNALPRLRGMRWMLAAAAPRGGGP